MVLNWLIVHACHGVLNRLCNFFFVSIILVLWSFVTVRLGFIIMVF